VDLYFDRATNTLTKLATGAGLLKSIEEKRGDTVPLRLHVRDGNASGTLAVGFVVRFGIKATIAGGLLALADEWTENAGVYEATLSLNTAELQSAIGVANSLSCLSELTISEDAEATWVSSQTIPFTVRNDVNKEADGAPTNLPGPIDWLAEHGIVYDPLIVDLTGGEATKLDAVATVDLPEGTLHAVMVSSTFVSIYALLASDNPEDAPDYVRPDDYADGTNEKVWTLREMRSLRVIATDYLQGRSVKVVTDAGSGQIKGDNLTDARELQLPDRSGALGTLVATAGNTTDNAGIALVAGVLKAVVRNQDTDDWHEVIVRDSGLAAGGAATGIPTFVISDPL